MPDTMAVELDLAPLVKDIKLTSKVRKALTDVLAESEARFDMEFRKEDFGSIVRLRRVKPAIRDSSGAVISAANTEGDLPVKSGRFVAGWNWKIKGLNATVTNQVPYAAHARKVDEEPGEGVKVVTRHLEQDWQDVAESMADIIQKHIEGP